MDGRKIITAGLIPVLAVMCGMLCGASHRFRSRGR